jgi:voltage-gated potassium channel
MKKVMIQQLENKVPILIGSIIVLNGLLHILVSVIPIFRIAIPGLDEVGSVLAVTSFQGMGMLVGIFLGFCLITIGRGVCERKRKSWFMAVVVLLVLCLNNYYTGALPKTSIISGALLFALLLTFKLYNEKTEDTAAGYQQVLAWVSIIIALGYGIIGSYFLRDQFNNIKSLADSVYFTMVTYSTVGYGDISPITQEAKFFTISMIMVGLGAFATTFTFVIGPMIENRIKGVFSIMKKINNIRNHVIICGYTNLAKALIKKFKENNVPFIVLENSIEKRTELEEDYMTIHGITYQKDTFINARISHAKSVICAFESDSENILTILTVKEVLEETNNTKTKLISRIDYEENIEKARKLGVTDIVSPTTMAAASIVNIL